VFIGTVALIALGAAALLVARSEQRIAGMRAATRAFDIRAREAADALADLRLGQAAYVAAGQGVAFWIPKVASTADTVAEKLATLRSTATSSAAHAALGDAARAATEFSSIDTRARDYLKASQQLMAADVIFTEGSEAAAATARHVQLARTAEDEASDAAEAAARLQEAAAAGGAAIVLAIAVLLLIRVPAAAEETGAGPLSIATAPQPAIVNELPLREPAAPASGYMTSRPAGPVLRSAAQLCTDFGRVSDLEELRALLASTADVMDASGLMVWLTAAGGTDLQPALSHGYGPQALARMPTIPRSADNAAAAAVRTGQLQIVLARPGSSNGAVVAPLLAPQGCIGALSAEIRGGGETSDAVQALAAIFAAQLAGVLHAAPVAEASEQRRLSR
jgi:hypothetical protein